MYGNIFRELVVTLSETHDMNLLRARGEFLNPPVEEPEHGVIPIDCLSNKQELHGINTIASFAFSRPFLLAVLFSRTHPATNPNLFSLRGAVKCSSLLRLEPEQPLPVYRLPPRSAGQMRQNL